MTWFYLFRCLFLFSFFAQIETEGALEHPCWLYGAGWTDSGSRYYRQAFFRSLWSGPFCSGFFFKLENVLLKWGAGWPDYCRFNFFSALLSPVFPLFVLRPYTKTLLIFFPTSFNLWCFLPTFATEEHVHAPPPLYLSLLPWQISLEKESFFCNLGLLVWNFASRKRQKKHSSFFCMITSDSKLFTSPFSYPKTISRGL